MSFGGGISSGGTPSWNNHGAIDASLAANLPSTPIEGDTYRVSVAGNFGASALINPSGFYFDIGDLIVWNAVSSKWDAVDASDPISTEAYTTAWAGQTRSVAPKDVLNTLFVTQHTSLGLLSAGGLTAFATDTNYLSAASSLRAGIVALDAKAKSIQDELDTVETSSGLLSTGAITAFSTDTNYLSAASSLRAGIVALDTKAKNIQDELDTVETSAGLSSSGALAAFATDTVHLSAATTLRAGIVALDTRMSYGVRSIPTAAGTTTGLITDYIVVFTGFTTQTYNLPDAATFPLRTLHIKNRSTGAVTVSRSGSDTIDGSASSWVLASGDSLTVGPNSIDWVVL